jgi:hypothetical protein
MCNVVKVQKELAAFIFWDVAMCNVISVLKGMPSSSGMWQCALWLALKGTTAFIFWNVTMCNVVSVQKELLPSSSGM